jgi:hypothetical protein
MQRSARLQVRRAHAPAGGRALSSARIAPAPQKRSKSRAGIIERIVMV